jgi:hypothetical protein
MSLQHLTDASISAFYDNIRQQVDADRASKYRFATGEAVRRRAEELENELARRKLQLPAIKW